MPLFTIKRSHKVSIIESNSIELETRLQKLLDEEKCLKFTERITGKGPQCMINFEKNNYWAKFDRMNYKIPLKISEIKDYQITMIGKYPTKYVHYVDGKLPTDEKEYTHIKLTITINEHNGFEYYSVIEYIGREPYARAWMSYVNMYKMPKELKNVTATKISYI